MYYFIKFFLQKGEGDFPEMSKIKSLYPLEDALAILRSNMRFSLNNANELLPIEEYKILDNGLSRFEINENGYQVGPNPIIWLKLKEEVDPDDTEYWIDVLSSDYELSIKGINEENPFYFQDHNGYSDVICAEWLADELWDKLMQLLPIVKFNESIKLSEDLKIKKNNDSDLEELKISFEINFNNRTFIWGWTFENESDLEQLIEQDKFYSDEDGCEYPEENSDLLFIHLVIYDYQPTSHERL